MAWYTEIGEQQDVVLSTRVRFARNLSDYPFAMKLNPSMASEIINTVKKVFTNYSEVSFSDISAVEAKSYVERHYASLEFIDKRIPRTLLISEKDKVQIMLCEEDHIRLQSIVAGLNFALAFECASKADEKLSKNLKLAYNEKYGFLTHCPTNLGNAMRVSVMLFLPALTKTRQIDIVFSQLSKLGFTIRGIYGEGSNAEGYIYQLSNRSSLGMTESEILKNINDITVRIIKNEIGLRNELYKRDFIGIRDKICRSFGILKNAYVMSGAEFNEHLANIRLGLSLGVLSGVEIWKITELMIAAQSATLMQSAENLNLDLERDKARATLVKNTLAPLIVKE